MQPRAKSNPGATPRGEFTDASVVADGASLDIAKVVRIRDSGLAWLALRPFLFQMFALLLVGFAPVIYQMVAGLSPRIKENVRADPGVEGALAKPEAATGTPPSVGS